MVFKSICQSSITFHAVILIRSAGSAGDPDDGDTPKAQRKAPEHIPLRFSGGIRSGARRCSVLNRWLVVTQGFHEFSYTQASLGGHGLRTSHSLKSPLD